MIVRDTPHLTTATMVPSLIWKLQVFHFSAIKKAKKYVETSCSRQCCYNLLSYFDSEISKPNDAPTAVAVR